MPARSDAAILERVFDSPVGGAAFSDLPRVSAWVRRRRLECSRRDLANPRLAGETIAAVARRWGFVDPAHFSRCFRAEFGASPRELRAAG
jgi:AraC-like DNA-binding protein